MKKIKALSAYFHKSIWRFLVIGGISTTIDFIIYYCFSNYIDISAAKVISMCAASVFSFYMNKKWTFMDQEKNSVKKVAKYVIVQIVNITINTVVNRMVYIMTSMKIIAFVIATVVAMCANYLLQRTIVFRKKENQV